METSKILAMKLVKNEKKYWEFIRLTRNDPRVQQGFIEQIQITSAQQEEYMKKNNDIFHVCITDEGTPIGYAGIVSGDIRIAVIPEYQRQGVGRFIITELTKKGIDFSARVKLDNIASKRLFESCGFEVFNDDDKLFYLERL
jgi:RimJ/RimL family protein N-acetyltransferase